MANLNTSTPYIKDWLLPSTAVLNGSNTGYNVILAREDIEFLNNKLNAATRELSVYDFYNISVVIENRNNFNTIINNLIPGQAAIIGAESFTDATGESYSRGDIILKLPDYTLHHIAGIRGGLFYPSKLELESNDNSYTLTFTNTILEPTDGESKISSNNNIWTVSSEEVKKNITFKTIATNTTRSPYNVQGVPSNNIVTFHNVNTNVDPIIKCYFNNMEEIYCTYNINKDGHDYSLLDAEPDDWDINYMYYYTKSGNEFYPITTTSAPTWAENTYYTRDTLTISNLPSCVALVVVK